MRSLPGGLILVLVLGSDEYGARRWITLGAGITVQPSEVAKLAVASGGAAFAGGESIGFWIVAAGSVFVAVKSFEYVDKLVAGTTPATRTTRPSP